jgi:hypothetical protein
MHFDIVNGKKVSHKAIPFDESHQFRNFYAIARLEGEIARKVQEGLRGVTANLEAVVHTVLYGSDLFLEIFNNSSEAIGEYLYLRSIQKGQEMGLLYAFSEALCAGLLANQDRRVGKAFKEVCRESPEWEHLNAEFNLASGINSSNLEQFIEKEAGYFVGYCQKVGEQGKEFSINDYVSLRSGSTEY